jgi:hypothetical protein
MKILIASPTYDGSVRKEYMQSIMRLTDYFRQTGIAWEMILESSTMLHVVRGIMASKALLDGEVTHLLFVDTDMHFDVDTVHMMIEAHKEVIGCACPYRTIPYFDTVKTGGQTFRQTLAEGLPYNIKFAPGTKNIDVKEGICEVASIGTGLLLISRSALEQLQGSSRVRRYVAGFPYNQWYGGTHYFGFFEHLQIDEAFIGEDYSFCMRWTEDCKGRIHAVINKEIVHIGNIPIPGRYLDRLKAGML